MTYQAPQLGLDPCGSIGFVPHDSSRVLLRFDEPEDDVRPSDAIGSVVDLNIDDPSTTWPVVVDGYVGRAREFAGGDLTGLVTTDVVSGDSLLTRDMTIRAIVRWDIDDQGADEGVIVCRGINTNAANYVAYGIKLVVTNAGTRTGEVRMFWHDTSGVLHTCTGGEFKLSRAREWMIITVTRRWVSSSEVEVRYYVDELLVGEVTDANGDIGGGTTGSLTVGARNDNGTWGDFLCGAIDELEIIEGALSAEEIALTYERITKWQPMGEQLALDCHPPGWPLDMSPSTRVGRETRLIGHGLGFSAALAENLRRNLLPDRAYGEALERWQRITQQPSRLGDSIETRRERIIGHLRQRAGVSPDGVRAALRDLLAVTDSDDIEILACSNTYANDDSALAISPRWRADPSSVWTMNGAIVATVANGTALGYDTDENDWATLLMGADGPVRGGGMPGSYGHELFAALYPSMLPSGGAATLPAGSEMGLVFHDIVRGDSLLVGLRNDGGVYKVISQAVIAGTFAAATVHATTSATTHWLHVRQDTPTLWTDEDADSLQDHTVRWSTTSATSGFSEATAIQFSLAVGWVGLYVRTYAGGNVAAPGIVVGFGGVQARFPHGRSPFYFYAYVDPLLAGDYDLRGANAVLRRLKQSHTHAAAIDSLSFIAGNENCLCGVGPCGTIE